MSTRGSFELMFREDGSHYHVYQCPSQSYKIDEETCSLRQEKGYFKSCRRCTFRKGGKNDPRERREE